MRKYLLILALLFFACSSDSGPTAPRGSGHAPGTEWGYEYKTVLGEKKLVGYFQTTSSGVDQHCVWVEAGKLECESFEDGFIFCERTPAHWKCEDVE